jgi:hypothetical protein
MVGLAFHDRLHVAPTGPSGIRPNGLAGATSKLIIHLELQWKS